MNLNTLCNFANGTFVTLDEYLPDTGHEPNAMELTDVMDFAGTTELNDAASSDINFQDSLDYTTPSSDLYTDDDALDKLLAEVHRDCANYRRAEGCKRQSVVSVSHRRSIERENQWKKSLKKLKERESSSGQIRTMLNEQRKRLSLSIAKKFFITNSLQLKQNKNAKFYRKNYGVSKRIFVKFINKIL